MNASVVSFSSIQNTLPFPTVLSTPMTPPIHSTRPPGNDQSDAGSLLGIRLLAEAIERLEKLRKLIAGQAVASVSDADADRICAVQCTLHNHRSACTVVFDRVGKKVDKNLLYPGPVGFDKAWCFKMVKAHADAMLFRQRFYHRFAFVHDFRQ